MVETTAVDARSAFAPFVREWVDPGSDARDVSGAEIPRDVMRRAWREGLFGLALPRELGGAGMGLRQWGEVLEQLGHLCQDTSFPTLLSARVWLTTGLFEAAGPELVERYVRPMARAELFGSFAYSDGADPFDFTTTVRRDGDELVVTGVKDIVTGAAHADLFLVFAADDDHGMSAVVVERGDAGVSVEPVDSMGMRGLGLGRLRLTEVRVPAWRLVTADGLTLAQRMLDARRPLLVTSLVGAMRALHERCVDHARRTTRYGIPLAEMQNVQAALGRQYVAIESSRAILRRALEVGDDRTHGTFDPVVSAAKYEVSRHGLDVGVSALRLLGGHGYLRGRAERFLRDVCALLAAGGTQDVIEVNLGALALADHGIRP